MYQDDMIRLHGIIRLEKELNYSDREMLANLLEAMTNLDSLDKWRIFSDLVSCYPRMDVISIAKTLKV